MLLLFTGLSIINWLLHYTFLLILLSKTPVPAHMVQSVSPSHPPWLIALSSGNFCISNMCCDLFRWPLVEPVTYGTKGTTGKKFSKTGENEHFAFLVPSSSSLPLPSSSKSLHINPQILINLATMIRYLCTYNQSFEALLIPTSKNLRAKFLAVL